MIVVLFPPLFTRKERLPTVKCEPNPIVHFKEPFKRLDSFANVPPLAAACIKTDCFSLGPGQGLLHSVLNHSNEKLEPGLILFLQYLILSLVLPLPNSIQKRAVRAVLDCFGPYSELKVNTYKTESQMAAKYTDR